MADIEVKYDVSYAWRRKGSPMAQFKKAARSSISNRYLLSNIVYVAYAIGILQIDYGTENISTRRINNLYLGWAIVHVISAFLYWWSWTELRWYQIPVWPEYLNMMGAALYLSSAILYRYEDPLNINDKTTLRVHYIESAAACIEVVAAFGWNISWYLTFKRRPGQGWTLDDPDTWANLNITIPSLIYLVYNAQILMNPEEYNQNFLYIKGDILYFAGSVFYLLAALRDDGWFWFMPLAGGFHYYYVDDEEKLQVNESV